MLPMEWRTVIKRNKGFHAHFDIDADGEVFLPRILVNHGFFESTSQVKKNQPDLWIQISDDIVCHIVKMSWCTILIWTEDC